MPTSVSGPEAAPAAAPIAKPSMGLKKISPMSAPQKPPLTAPVAVRLTAWFNLTLPFSSLTATTASSRSSWSVPTACSNGSRLRKQGIRLDVTRPANDTGDTIAAFVGLTLLALKRRHATVGKGDRLGAVVGGEYDDRVVELTHVFELLEDIADVVVQLLHAGFIDAPILAALHSQHSLILRRQHGGNVHARRVIPNEERLSGLLGVVAVEEVDDMARDFLVHGSRPIQGERAFVLVHLVFRRAVGGFAPEERARRRQAYARLGVDSTRDGRDAGNRYVLAGWRNALLGRRFVDVVKAHLLHGVEVVQVAPKLLEPVRCRQGVRVVAQVVLPELASVVAEIQQELGKAWGTG